MTSSELFDIAFSYIQYIYETYKDDSIIYTIRVFNNAFVIIVRHYGEIEFSLHEKDILLNCDMSYINKRLTSVNNLNDLFDYIFNNKNIIPLKLLCSLNLI